MGSPLALVHVDGQSALSSRWLRSVFGLDHVCRQPQQLILDSSCLDGVTASALARQKSGLACLDLDKDDPANLALVQTVEDDEVERRPELPTGNGGLPGTATAAVRSSAGL